MNDEKNVLLLCDSTSHNKFVELANAKKWKLITENKGDGKVTGFGQAWICGDDNTEIQYIHEPGLGGISFLVVHGPIKDNLLDIIAIELDVRTSINVVRLASEAKTDEEKCESAYELAVVFPDYDQQAMEILKDYYYEGSDQVRIRVVQALTYRGWSQGIDFLDKIAKIDDYSDLRKYATEMSDMWKARRNK